MKLPNVSIIIPCYNMEKYLKECMDSVLQQTLENIELICIDDGSTDRTSNMLDDYQQHDQRVKVIHQANRGVAASRNTGIIQATGEYIAFMDPDDFYPNSKTLELLYTKASKNNALICGGSFSVFDEQTKKVSTDFIGDSCKYIFHSEGYIAYSDYQFDFGYHRFLYSRKLLINNNIFFPPYSRFQDPPFFVKAMIEAKSFYAIPDVVYRYRFGFQAKPAAWPRTKLHDMMRGHLDNLLLSSQAELCELHALTVRRFEANDIFEAVMKSLQKKDQETLKLLIQMNAAIKTDLLKQSGMLAEHADGYTLREFRALLDPYADTLEEKLQNTVYELESIKSTWSFRIGRIITFLPRKVCGFVRCIQENGVSYSICYAIKKIKSAIKS